MTQLKRNSVFPVINFILTMGLVNVSLTTSVVDSGNTTPANGMRKNSVNLRKLLISCKSFQKLTLP